MHNLNNGNLHCMSSVSPESGEMITTLAYCH